MKPEKVGKNKTYRKKTLKSKQVEKETPTSWQLPHSIVIRFTGSVENTCTSQNEQASGNYDNTEDEVNFDISTLAETCVFDELEQSKSVELPAMVIKHKADSSLTSLMNPVLDITLEEEFKIHQLEAIKESLFDRGFKALQREIPNFQKMFSSLLISLSQGFSSSVSSQAILVRQKKIGTVIFNDLFNGGKICSLLNCYSSFQNVPDKVKMETLKFSLSVTDLCTK